MSLIRKHFEDRRSWLEGRQELGLGGSDAAAVCGLSPWMSPVELWKIKTGQKKAKDISSDEVVERGVRMEPALRTLYAAMNPTVQVEYYPFDILAQSERPWLTSTLDGELIDENGRRGILEIKTGQTMKKADYEKWSDGKIPDNYYCQTLFQLLATGWEFVDLFAALEDIRGDWSIRTRHIERASCEDDLAWLLEKAEIFWGYVQRRQMPPMVLRL
ncbi:MAG: lambda-exonuclease family protein [Oscillospiraceae bacterium]|jgi:putative phage-type endonuclease